jgi:hypothetical protein
MVAEELGEEHAPPNMVTAFKQLRALYGEPLIPLKLGTDFHGGHTDMTQIEVGKDQMMLTILPNHHEVPKKFQDSAAFFVVGHEFGHITSHPGKEAKYWRAGMRELPVEHFQQPRWFNAISDILVNWTVITGTNIVIDAQRPFIQPQMLAGWQAGQFIRRCGNMTNHADLLEAGRLTDNRYCPSGGVIGQYDNPDPADPFKPGLDTPYWERFQGHGRGEQYYPPVSYSVAKNLSDKFKTVKMKKGQGGIRAGQTYVVEATKTFDDRINSEEWEPMKEFKINGTWVDTRYCVGVCPHCGAEAPTIWERWWGFKSKEDVERIVAQQGSWVHLLIQMFAFEWAAAYSTFFPYGRKTGKKAGKQFLLDLGETMNKVMRGE